MPKNDDIECRIRARMEETGESRVASERARTRRMVGPIVSKADERTTVSVQVEGLGSEEKAEALRGFWGERLDRMKTVLEDAGP